MFLLSFVSSVVQFVVTGIEGEGLHDISTSPQELTVQLPHCNTYSAYG